MSEKDVCPYPGCGTRFLSYISKDSHRALYPHHFAKTEKAACKPSDDDGISFQIRRGAKISPEHPAPCGATSDPNVLVIDDKGPVEAPLPAHVNARCVLEKPENDPAAAKPKAKKKPKPKKKVKQK